jgi:Zn-dependent peptidase ImmA (M78 family)
MTMVLGSDRLIVHNERHAPTRQASNLAHELAHYILGHPPSEGLGDGGCRRFDADQEDEAGWLGGALLVPRDGALTLFRNGMPVEEMPKHFGVSEQMCGYRLRMTGVLLQVERMRDLVKRRRS